MMNRLVIVVFACIISNAKQYDLETCRSPIGIETGKISDSAFSSSSHAQDSTKAHRARIRSETDGWCPLNKVSSISYEYIQIDLVNLTVITLIELQGKYSLIPNDRFADAFRVEYRREKSQNWIEYKDFSGQYILSGSSNSYIPTIRDIIPSIIAREIRIIPIVTGPKPKYICMRLEIYGCSYPDDLISYSMPQGDKRGYDAQFLDETYDGLNENGTLKDGLGQLTDGILAYDDYRLMDNVQGIGSIGYDWIGWRRKSSLTPYVNLIFYFETVRNFSSIHIHTSNLFTRDIHLFHSIVVVNCEHQDNRKNVPVNFIVPYDNVNTSARFIHVDLTDEQHFLTNCLDLKLIYSNRNPMLLDEIMHYITSHVPLWYWCIITLGSLSLCLILSIVIYIRCNQANQRRNKFSQMSNKWKSSSYYRPIPKMGSCINARNTSCMSSIANHDSHHHLMISTSNSSRSMSGSGFSPVTISTIYQPSHADPYLSATSSDTPTLTTNPYSFIDVYTGSLSDAPTSTQEMVVNIQGPCGNNLYATLFSFDDSQSIYISCINDEYFTVEQPFSSMNGCFGTIFRGYLNLPKSNHSRQPILIKALTTNDDVQKELFDKEHLLLNYLDHPNLVQFYGYTVGRNSALIEDTDLSDLHTYLVSSKTISVTVRLHFMTQLSNALHYLESHEIIHRDIAARNCLIYSNYELKLTNTAMACEQFQSQYYKIEQVPLPLRWMAPECIGYNQFTLQSDVWSFGITFWEVMTNCVALPYSQLSDEQVYQRLKLTKGLHLSRPNCLSKELIDLMLECWRPCNERPKFQEISTFLSKRLYGINIV